MVFYFNNHFRTGHVTNKEVNDVYNKNRGIVHDVCKQVCKALGVDKLIW